MSLQRYSKTIFLLIFGIALLLVACERPADDVVDIPQTGGGEQVTETQEGAAEEGAETTAEEQAGEETVAEGEAAAEETAEGGEEATTEETAEGEAGEEASPRTDEEGAETTEEAATEEGAEETEEATAEETEEVATEEGAETTEEATTEETEEAATEEGAETTEEATTEETATEEAATEESITVEGSTEERIHVVADGENLYRIGLQYGLSWVVLQQYNGIANVNSLTVGQEVKIPPTETETAEPDEPAPTPTPTPTDEQTYTVQEGDNLFRIGLEYGLDWTQIAEANGIVNPQQLTVGQVLKIPASQPGESPEFTHVVQDGETLFLISIQYGTTWNSIAEANELESPFVIYPDQTLIIPGS